MVGAGDGKPALEFVIFGPVSLIGRVELVIVGMTDEEVDV
jgi:hypothetical protein